MIFDRVGFNCKWARLEKWPGNAHNSRLIDTSSAMMSNAQPPAT